MKNLIAILTIALTSSVYATLPPAPSNLNATAVSPTEIDLSWQDNSTDETGFRVQRLNGSSYNTIASPGANATTYRNTGLTPGTTYSYQVRAYNGSGNSAPSNQDSATTPNATPTPTPTPPPGPTPIQAKSASQPDVANAIALASDGDTVLVPAGTASWTQPIDTPKGISIIGATTITGTRDAPIINDQTIILDNVPRSAPQPMLIRSTTPLGKSFRLSGFTFRKGAITQIADNGGVRLGGFSQASRVDHCHFDSLYQNPDIATSNCVFGVVDHCVFDLPFVCLSFEITHSAWLGQGDHGDYSWADLPYFGTNKFLFIEDCTFNKPDGTVGGGGIDSSGGGRYVARYNRFNNLGTNSHGTETTGRYRSIRVNEVYNNTFNFTAPGGHQGELRGGTMVTHDNTWIGTPPANGTSLTVYREFYSYHYWGGANGSNSLDSNDPALYLSGAAAAGSGASKLVVAGANFAPNQWVGYSVTNTTVTFQSGTGAGFHPSSYVTSSTSNTLNLQPDNVDGPLITFAQGDNFEVRKVLIALDQPGRGKGDLITDLNPVGNDSWPRQASEPVYSWNNIKATDGSAMNLVAQEPSIVAGRDYFNGTPMPGYTPYLYPHDLAR